jgi:hypothetical protein
MSVSSSSNGAYSESSDRNNLGERFSALKKQISLARVFAAYFAEIKQFQYASEEEQQKEEQLDDRTEAHATN